MKRLLFILFGFVLLSKIHAQSVMAHDTVSTIYSKMGTIWGDTSFLSPLDNKGFERFFYRNIEAPMIDDKPVTGFCNLYFIVDKSGNITQAWYDQKMNAEIGAAALAHLKTYPKLKPTLINKEPVITKMMVTLAVVSNEETETAYPQYKEQQGADLIVVVYGVQRKQVANFSRELH